MTLPFFNDFPLFIGINKSLIDLSVLFYGLSILFLFLEQSLGKLNLRIRYSEVLFFTCLVICILASILWNLNSSISVCGMNFCGDQRLVNSGISITVKLFLILGFLHQIRVLGLLRVSAYVRYGFYLSFFYVLIELVDVCLPYYLNLPSLGILGYVEPFFHQREWDFGLDRTRGLAFEPSYQAVYLIVCLPFLFADIKKNRRNINLLLWVVCLLSSGSLAGIISGLIFFLTYNLKKENFFYVSSGIAIFIICIFIGINNIDFNAQTFTSTMSRVGSWVAGYLATMDNLTFGVGPGMSGYWLTNYYPDFFFISIESQGWFNDGIFFFDAPTFASLISFSLDLGLVPLILIFVYLMYTGAIQDAMKSNIGAASVFSTIIVSFGFSGYLIWHYALLLAITLMKSWGEFDALSTGNSRVPCRVKNL